MQDVCYLFIQSVYFPVSLFCPVLNVNLYFVSVLFIVNITFYTKIHCVVNYRQRFVIFVFNYRFFKTKMFMKILLRFLFREQILLTVYLLFRIFLVKRIFNHEYFSVCNEKLEVFFKFLFNSGYKICRYILII